MNPVIRFALISNLAITGCRAYLHEILGKSDLRFNVETSLEAHHPGIGPSTPQLSPTVRVDCAHDPLKSGSSVNTFGTNFKDPPVEHLGQPYTHQLRPQTSDKTPAFQNGADPMLNLGSNVSHLKRNRDSENFSALSPSSNRSQKPRLSQYGNMNELENVIHGLPYLNHEQNFMDSSIDLDQFIHEEILPSSSFGGSGDSFTSTQNHILQEEWNPFLLDLSFNPNGETSGVSDMAPMFHVGIVQDEAPSKPHVSPHNIHSKNAFSPYHQAGLDTQGTYFTQGDSRSDSDNILKSDSFVQFENQEDSTEPFSFEFNQHEFDFPNPEYKLYANYVGKALRDTGFQNEIFEKGTDLSTFSSYILRGEYQKTAEEIEKLGTNDHMGSIRSKLLNVGLEFCIEERPTWLQFFNEKYNFQLESYIPACNFAGSISIFPVYLFYVEMINKIIPPAELEKGGIISACKSYQSFTNAYTQTKNEPSLLQSKMKSTAINKLKLLLWDFLEFWMKENRKYLFESVKSQRNGVFKVELYFRGFFNLIFSLHIEGLTTKLKKIGYTRSNPDHDLKSDHSLQSETRVNSRKPSQLTFDQYKFAFRNPQYELYANYVGKALRNSPEFPNGIVGQGAHLGTFFDRILRGIYYKDPEEIDKLGNNKETRTIRSKLLDLGLVFCIKQRETWFQFFNKKYGLEVEIHIRTCNLAGPVSIFPVYLFYVEMINEIIPPAEQEEGGILPACESYTNFINAHDQPENVSSLLKPRMKSKGIRNLKLLLWDFLEFWMQENRKYLFRSVSVVKKQAIVVEALSRGFFNLIFSLHVERLTTELKKTLKDW